MEFPQFKQLVADISIGKHLPDAVYVHNSALGALAVELVDTTLRIADALKIPDESWNIVKYSKRDYKVSLLHYPDFDGDPYPALARSNTIDLAKLAMREAKYDGSANPPILHRKETFVLVDHPLYEEFVAITAEGEALGLYENTRSIGFRKNWERLIASKGYCLDEQGHLVPKFDRPIPTSEGSVEVRRHRTAIDRNQLSQPMQILARHGYLDGTLS